MVLPKSAQVVAKLFLVTLGVNFFMKDKEYVVRQGRLLITQSKTCPTQGTMEFSLGKVFLIEATVATAIAWKLRN